jgi:hypothetical protein
MAASFYKSLGANDATKTTTLINESIPITGSLLSGTYGSAPYVNLGSERNIKNYSHGMFQSVFDYPYLSSSANKLFDVTFGYSAKSAFSGNLASTSRVQQSKKINIYNQMAQILAGHDLTGGIKEFRWGPEGEVMRECFFMNLSRLLTKDEIKKGSFELHIGTGSAAQPFAETLSTAEHIGYQIIKRPAGATGVDKFYTDSPAGEYALLSASHLKHAGLLYYQAGIVVLTASLLRHPSGAADVFTTDYTHAAGGHGKMSELSGAPGQATAGAGLTFSENNLAIMTGSSISSSCNEFRHRLRKVTFNNTTELHSTIYYIRANHNDFNYSSNPTYLTGSKIRVKTSTTEAPISYITTVGMYSADNELLAVAKVSEPIKKTPEVDLTMRVRLDY